MGAERPVPKPKVWSELKLQEKPLEAIAEVPRMHANVPQLKFHFAVVLG